MVLEAELTKSSKLLKWIIFLRNSTINIGGQGYHAIGEKDEKLEQLPFAGGMEKLGGQNLGSRYACSSVCAGRAVKKTRSLSPGCGSSGIVIGGSVQSVGPTR